MSRDRQLNGTSYPGDYQAGHVVWVSAHTVPSSLALFPSASVSSEGPGCAARDCRVAHQLMSGRVCRR